MQTATWRFPLAVGFNRSRTCRVVSFTILGITLTGAGACLGYALGLRVTGQDSINATAPLASVLAAALAALAVASSGLVIAFVSRAGAWLEGPFLTVRRLGARTVNLAAARSVAVTATRGGPLTPDTPLAEGMTRTPVLIIGDGDQTVRLRLRSRDGTLLSPGQMRVLADALAVADCPGAFEAVMWLRSMAADPRTLLL
ncbi:MAG: hypothetical protein DIU79_09060 [Actinobacteria bacterium]|nr:MAG: hypothetical protein DIU79_09060 [Actinomycetota bacterium]